MSFLRSILATIVRFGGAINRISRMQDPTRRRALYRDCLRISFRYAILVKLFRHKIHQERVLNFRVAFFHYESFYTLFEELFLGEVYLLECASSDPLILDGGANIGMSVLYFKSLYPSSRIVAFEPDPDTFQMLQRNIEANKLSGIELHNSALGALDGETNFYYMESRTGWLSQSATASVSDQTSVKRVRVQMLSPFISSDVDILKLDVEGAEDDVISELEAHDKLSCVRKIILEYHHHLYPRTDRLGAFLSTLERNNFGYQFISYLPMPFPTASVQWFILYAYSKTTLASASAVSSNALTLRAG